MTKVVTNSRLAALRLKLDFIRMDPLGPIQMAAQELLQKEKKDPEDLLASAKLYRAIDDLETARDGLAQVAAELRQMTG
ncbi:MAG: hypothetical protein KKC79_21205 [Gammaproteobacteria bacterium]|nr:hypothetical protein [Gammaproteobacteria bacterium]MBU1440998.1 hypothetical protein [Gammaproteobacteria bacterium]MBU2285037.1 hypothetical protein [Gammaproteobacteria bacterium]MBU2411157.1 hypothetical protein [Gammaproteobacteria bacterium]